MNEYNGHKVYRLKVRETEFEKTQTKKIKRF